MRVTVEQRCRWRDGKAENERLLAEIEQDLLRTAIIDAKIAAQLRRSIQRNAKMAAALRATLTYLENGRGQGPTGRLRRCGAAPGHADRAKAGASAMTMWPSAAMIAAYLEEWLPDKDGEIHVAFTSKQRDQIVAALRLREAAEPFITFAKSGSFKLFGDDFVLTNGSRLAHRQLTAGDFRALLAAAGEEEA